MIYLTSDTHFNHKKIIDFENRPFESVEEMNEALILNWNKVVSNKDTIYHLVDFAWGNKQEIKNFVSQLNGYKILIKGNHDRGHSKTQWHDVGFNDVIDGGIILEEFYFLSHEPLYMNSNMPYVNLHGHLHSGKMESLKYYNVGVELHSYALISFDLIKESVDK